ncbi:SH3 domain-containing protein [Benzoatithermus flavus]|uniref:SH3 domain-containing protein n=1 Tax=Benzoatithermus flavus TaxID=3108223 RepID=A0ABU8XQ05_9PROT
MHRFLTSIAAIGCAAMLSAVAASPVMAATGDTLRVVGERVNLRAGPSDDANVRTQVMQGEQLLELRREGNWYGVRVLRTGEEGWIFGNLVEPVAASTLGGGEAVVAHAGFQELSRDFDRLMGVLAQRYGFPLFEKVHQAGNNTLEVTLTPQWLRAGSDDEHLLAATAIYQMWKNHQNSTPVRVVVLDPQGKRYITIDDTQGPDKLLSLAAD